MSEHKASGDIHRWQGRGGNNQVTLTKSAKSTLVINEVADVTAVIPNPRVHVTE